MRRWVYFWSLPFGLVLVFAGCRKAPNARPNLSRFVRHAPGGRMSKKTLAVKMMEPRWPRRSGNRLKSWDSLVSQLRLGDNAGP